MRILGDPWHLSGWGWWVWLEWKSNSWQKQPERLLDAYSPGSVGCTVTAMVKTDEALDIRFLARALVTQILRRSVAMLYARPVAPTFRIARSSIGVGIGCGSRPAALRSRYIATPRCAETTSSS